MKSLTLYIKEHFIPFGKRGTYKDHERIANFISRHNLSSTARQDMFRVLDALCCSDVEMGLYPEEITVSGTPQGHWRVYFKGKDTGITIAGNLLHDESIEELEWRYYSDVTESTETVEDKIFKYLQPYIHTNENYECVKEDYIQFVNNVIKPVEKIVKNTSGSGNITVRVYNDVIYVCWIGSSDTYKDKEICLYFTNLPVRDESFCRFKVNWPVSTKGVSCQCSETLKEKLLEEMHPSTKKLFS